MKIALVSANVGGFDKVHRHVAQNVDYDYYYFNESNLPFPLHGLSNRMKAKYIKLQTHRFIEADVIIWIDGSFEITSPFFIDWITKDIHDHDFRMPLHPKRPNAYEEMNFLIDCLKDGEKYVGDRYKGINFEKELDYYMSQYFPVNYPLYACGVFARWNDEDVNSFFDRWWMMCLEFSEFDQGIFSLNAFKSQAFISSFNFSELDNYTKRHKHESD